MLRKIYPPVVIVDENDIEIGHAPLARALEEGLYHRVVCIFLTDELNRMLIQKRGEQVGVSPGCWDISVAGHVDDGNSYIQAAQLELAEEAGLRDIKLETLGTHPINRIDGNKIINQFERVFCAQILSDRQLTPQPDEVAELRWFSKDELRMAILKSRDTFTSGLLENLARYFPDYLPR